MQNATISKYRYFILLGGVVFLAAVLRLWNLGGIPPGLYPDEAAYGMDAVRVHETKDYRVFYPANNGREGLFINIVSLVFDVFGVGIWQLRMVSGIFGTLTVVAVWLLARELFSPVRTKRISLKMKNLFNPTKHTELIAMSSAFFVATSFWHLNFSRIGFRAITMPFFLTLAMWLLMRAIKYQKTKDFVLGGIVFGLGFYTYLSFRVAILLPPILFLLELAKYLKTIKVGFHWGWLKKMYGRDGWWRWDIYFALVFLTLLPLLLYFTTHPEDIISRASGISIFAKENPLKELVVSTLKTLGMFHIYGDGNWRHNSQGSPQLFWPVGALFLLGIIISAKELLRELPTLLRKRGRVGLGFSVYGLLFSWFFALLLPSILTAEGLPHALRSIGVIPPAYIFAGIGMAWISERIASRWRLVGLSVFYLSLLFFIIFQYFFRWAPDPRVTQAFNQKLVLIGIYLDTAEGFERLYVIDEKGPWKAGNSIAIQSIRFVTYRKADVSYIFQEDIENISLLPQKNILLIPIRNEEEAIREAKRIFGDRASIRLKDGITHIHIR